MEKKVQTFEQLLCSIPSSRQNEYELILPAQMIEDICKENNYPCYQFAHDLEGNIYMRAKVNRITLEFLKMKSPQDKNSKNAVIFQIKRCGDVLYSKPNVPKGGFYLI